jgi:hypothetical protein
MAETLVALASFKRKMSRDTETVGGAQALLVVNPQSIVDGTVGFNAGNGLVISRLRQHREAEVWLIKFL